MTLFSRVSQDCPAGLAAQRPRAATGRGQPTLGIIGGGQLARMTAMATLKLGHDVVVLERSADAPAATLATHALVGDWNDPAVLAELATRADVVTLENEFVDAAALATLERMGATVLPGSAMMGRVQDKYLQKVLLRDAGIPVAPFLPARTPDELHAAAARLGFPFVLKARRDGYDGRGNRTVRAAEDLHDAYASLGGGTRPLYAEAWCDFSVELATIVVRGRAGGTAVYPVVETVQADHVCRIVRAPAAVDAEAARTVERLATAAAVALGAVGCLGVECFLMRDGSVLVNELAPRVHNSGHYTIEACACSQFENHARAVLGLPLGATHLVAPAAVMVNLLGQSAGPARSAGLDLALAVPGASVHIYGKDRSAPGRKLGHVTALGATVAAAEAVASRCASEIRFGAAS
ncbi:MAG: 5-(carboxyamino)imidazole ribonucleotide synthase [Gemmatimonadota bacterium]|nr:5-(carboxyamino)imidazole ribonucleotide synthase [Gemmatimonadota bacterium]